MAAHQSSSSFVDPASRIAAKLAETATTQDRVGQAPFAEVDVLRQSGLLELIVPVGGGGLGDRWTEAPELTRTIASGDRSIGQRIGYRHVGGASQDLRFSVRRNQHRDAQ